MIYRNELVGFLWATTPNLNWPVEPEELAAIKAFWQESFGERQQEIVNTGMDKAALVTAFD